MATAGSIVIDLLMRSGAFETDVKRAEKRLQQFQARAVEAGKVVGTALVAGAAAATAALTAMVVDATNTADQLDELSQRLGVSTEELSTLGYAAQRTGGNLDTITGALPKLSKVMVQAADSSSRAGKLFAEMGVEVKDAQGNLRDVADVLPEVATAFQQLENDTLEQALAMEIFGKSGADMLEFLNLGEEGIRAMQERARDLGLELSTDAANAAAAFKDQLDDLQGIMRGIGTDIMQVVLPPLTDMIEALVKSYTEGGYARQVVDDLAGALGRISIMFKFAAESADGYREVMDNIGLQGLFNEGSIAGGLGRVKDALDASQAELDALVAREALGLTGSRSTTVEVSEGIDFSLGAPLTPQQRRDKERRIAGALNGSGDTGRRTGRSGGAGPRISEEQRELERLQQQFEQLNARQAERIALMQEELRTGKEVTELWRVSYELQNGELAKLAPQQQEQLRTNAALTDELERQLEAKREDAEADERFTTTVEGLRAELEALTMTNEQLDLRNRLQEAGVTLDSERGQQIKAMTAELYDQAEAIGAQIELMDEFRAGSSDALADFVTGTKSAKDALRDFFDDMHQRIVQMIADKWMEQLFGQMGTTGSGTGGGDWLGQLFGGLFGAAGGGNTKSGGNLKGSGAGTGGDFWGSLFGLFFGGGRAGGGDVIGSRAYLVGENGPEMFVPRTAGTVIPNPDPVSKRHGSGSGMGVVNNFSLGAPTDPRTQAQIANRVGFETQRQMNRAR